MAIGQVTVPYIPGYDFGVGADLASGSPMGKVVTGPATEVEQASGATITFQVHRVQSTEDLEHALGIDAEASYGCGSFGPSMSMRFSYAKKSKLQSSSLFMLVTTHVRLAFLSIDEPILRQDAQNLVSNPTAFKNRYGNYFVRGIGRGGLFIGTIRIETESAEDSQNIAGELKGSYGVFSGEVKAKFAEVLEKYKTSTFIDMYHEGGPIDLRIEDLANPRQLLDNANRFLDSFTTDPDKSAVPYFVTLAPVAIAQGPVPPDQAQLEHAQDVLVYCSKERSRTLDKMNLLEYILDNSSRFEFPAGTDRTALQNALDDFQKDLELIARCASRAIQSPAEAVLPATYAEKNDTEYPLGKLPDDLPQPKAGKMVAVPDFSACKSLADCEATAASVGLVARSSPVPTEGEQFKVLDAVPPPGTSVHEGAVVTIVYQPAKVRVLPPEKVFRFRHLKDLPVITPG